MNPLPTKQVYIGIGLAVLATIVWAGNFVIARGVAEKNTSYLTRLLPLGHCFADHAAAGLA